MNPHDIDNLAGIRDELQQRDEERLVDLGKKVGQIADRAVPLDDAHRAEVMNTLSKEIGEWARGKGFREDWQLASFLESIAMAAKEDREHFGYINVDLMEKAAAALRINIIGTKLMLAVSELSEALESLRDHGTDTLKGAGNFGEELADTVIRLFDLAHMINSSIGSEVLSKTKHNEHRPHKHGRKV